MAGERSLRHIDVLIVDDNAHMRFLLREVLRAIGVLRVADVSNGFDALDHLAAKPVDVVLLDYAMPAMDGFEFLRRLRHDTNSPAPQARVIMVSGYCDLKHVNDARDAGADEFLMKPITATALMQRIDAIVLRPRVFVCANDFNGPDRRRRRIDPPGAERRSNMLDI